MWHLWENIQYFGMNWHNKGQTLKFAEIPNRLLKLSLALFNLSESRSLEENPDRPAGASDWEIKMREFSGIWQLIPALAEFFLCFPIQMIGRFDWHRTPFERNQKHWASRWWLHNAAIIGIFHLPNFFARLTFVAHQNGEFLGRILRFYQ